MINIDEGNVKLLENFFSAPVNFSARCWLSFGVFIVTKDIEFYWLC
jgi:hypothetical protein